MANTVVGVDIGSAAIRAVEVSNAAGAKPTVVRFGEIELPPGAAKKGEVVEPNTVASALKRLWSTSGFRSKSVVLGIGNQRVLARDLSVPAVPLHQIRESLPFQVQDLLPMPVSEAVLDFYPINESDSGNGRVINGLLIAAVKETVMTNLSAVRLAGLKPVGVDLIPFALTRLAARTEHSAGAVIIMDIGESTTSFVFAVDGVPQFVRLIGMGGGDVTRAIAQRLSMEEGTAENAKRQLGLATEQVPDGARPIVEIIYETTNELFTSIRNTITFVANTTRVSHIDRIVLSGNAARLSGLPRALAEYTRIPVVVADPFAGVALGGSARKADARERDGLAVALGLTLGVAA